MIILPAYAIGTSELRCCLATLRDRGLTDRVLLVADPHSLDSESPPAAIADDMSDPARVVDRIAAWGQDHDTAFDAVVGIDEELHFALSRGIASRFGLPFHTERTCLLASNKYLCKQAFLDQGVPTSPFALVSNPDLEAAAHVGYPNVLKVMSGTQSQFLFRNDTPEDFVAHFGRLARAAGQTQMDPRFDPQVLSPSGQTLDPRSQFLLESFVPGAEYSCDFLVRSGEVDLVRVTRKIPGPVIGIFGGYLLLDPASLDREAFDGETLLSLCRRIASAFEIRDAMCMVDFKADDGRLTVLESSIRPGFSAFNHLMYQVHGYTSLALMTMSAMKETITLQPVSAAGAVVYLLAPPGAEKAPIDTSRLLQRKKELGITALHLYDVEGTVSEVDPTPMLRGYVLLRHPNRDSLEATVAVVHASVDYGAA